MESEVRGVKRAGGGAEEGAAPPVTKRPRSQAAARKRWAGCRLGLVNHESRNCALMH